MLDIMLYALVDEVEGTSRDFFSSYIATSHNSIYRRIMIISLSLEERKQEVLAHISAAHLLPSRQDEIVESKKAGHRRL